ncbi:hypothetical protein HAX54_045483 [Datura stramonium]|uniref:Uncharacterized protein n=1 Tax=Datura stramonium TaxID=4076 RepID=A0ABS8WJQ0_DATST|nr:hypothetical protein [Datura stramonium]
MKDWNGPIMRNVAKQCQPQKASMGLVGVKKGCVGKKPPICLEESYPDGKNILEVPKRGYLDGRHLRYDSLHHETARPYSFLQLLHHLRDPNTPIIRGNSLLNRPLDVEKTGLEGTGGAGASSDPSEI